MNDYYKLLILFQSGERISKKYLLGRPGITKKLIDDAERQGFIQKIDKTDIGEQRYIITQSGIQKRDH